MASSLERHPSAAAILAAAALTGAVTAAVAYSQPYFTGVGNAILTGWAAFAGAMLLYAFYPSSSRAIAVVVLVATVPVVGLTWHQFRLVDRIPDGVAALLGGCPKYNLYGQNRYPPLGAALRAEPLPESAKVGSRAGNEIITVDGWVRTKAAYPTNPSPWNSDIWFHLADQSGWVSFAGVRSAPTSPNLSGLDPYGGETAGLDRTCEGSVRWP